MSSYRREPSLRAQAREHYRDADARAEAASPPRLPPPPSLTLPLKGGGNSREAVVQAQDFFS